MTYDKYGFACVASNSGYDRSHVLSLFSRIWIKVHRLGRKPIRDGQGISRFLCTAPLRRDNGRYTRITKGDGKCLSALSSSLSQPRVAGRQQDKRGEEGFGYPTVAIIE